MAMGSCGGWMAFRLLKVFPAMGADTLLPPLLLVWNVLSAVVARPVGDVRIVPWHAVFRPWLTHVIGFKGSATALIVAGCGTGQR
jgi:hypothetical protein